MKRLLIDTSTQALIIVLLDDFEVMDYIFKIVNRDHSTVLMPNIKNIIEKNNLDIKKIDEVIVGDGPGSYTGIRIGVTAAKTLSYALNIPLSKVSTLKLMSMSLADEAKYIAPIIDARRGNVFAGLYKVENNNLEIVLEDNLYNFNYFQNKIKKITGNSVVPFISNDDLVLNYDSFSFNIFNNVFNPSLIKYLEFEHVKEPHKLVPNYKRLTEAEINLK